MLFWYPKVNPKKASETAHNKGKQIATEAGPGKKHFRTEVSGQKKFLM